MIVREAIFGEDYVLEFCGATYSEVRWGKPKVAVVSDQVFTGCNSATMPLSEIKSYVVVMSFYIKNDETKNSSGLQFKA